MEAILSSATSIAAYETTVPNLYQTFIIIIIIIIIQMISIALLAYFPYFER
jgi:hypothetical protein